MISNNLASPFCFQDQLPDGLVPVMDVNTMIQWQRDRKYHEQYDTDLTAFKEDYGEFVIKRL